MTYKKINNTKDLLKNKNIKHSIFTTSSLVDNKSTQKYVNRELSLISFNERVLSMAEVHDIPLLEKLKYLCIVSNNLDELFEIRVAGLKAQMLDLSSNISFPDGLNVKETFLAVEKRTHALVERQYSILKNKILPLMKKEDILFFTIKNLNTNQKKWARNFFKSEILPVLTPIGLDPVHPFPKVLNKSLNFIVEVSGKDSYKRTGRVAIIQAPKTLPRLIELPLKLSQNKHCFILLATLIEEFTNIIFPGMSIQSICQFRVTRNSDLFVDDEEVTDIRQALQGELSQRNYGDAVRIEVSNYISEKSLNLLLHEFNLTMDDCYKVDGPVNLVRLMQLPELLNKPELKFKEFRSLYPENIEKNKNFFSLLKNEDILIHHPYNSFKVVSDFIRLAADDPNVVAISQTIYRTGSTSELMKHLIRAAKKGKEVTVIVELMARFDEETNISWASKLEQIGAHVVFGVVGNKTHAKMCLIIRKENGTLKRYCHLSTGNYHPKKAKLYTDFGLLTADKKICTEVHQIFHQLTGLGEAKKLKTLWQSPFSLHSNVIRAINRESKNAKLGKKSKIIAKMNSLVEIKTINALYKASQAGVSIELLVRGVCMLRPGVKNLSENIKVRSTIGRFLEHSRVYYFKNDGKDDLYLSSADWMDRNFFRRVEIAFPIINTKLKKKILYEGLRVHFKDDYLCWVMRSDGSYFIKRNQTDTQFSSHNKLILKYTK